MFDMSLQTLVNAIVSQELIGKGREKEGLLFSFDVSFCSYHETEVEFKEFDTRRGLHFLYQVNPNYTYVNVFSAVTERPFDSPLKATWKHECSHDSCWRNDVQAFNRLYFDMAEEINQKLVAAGLPRVAPKDMSQHIFPGGMSRNLYSWVACHITKDPADPHRYRKLVTLGKSQ